MDIDPILTKYADCNKAIDALAKSIRTFSHRIQSASTRRVRKAFEFHKGEVISEKEIANEELEKVISQYGKGFILVPGDESKFKKLAGFPVKIVDLGTPNKGVVFIENIGGTYERYVAKLTEYQTPIKLLLEKRVIGMINVQITQSSIGSSWDAPVERVYYGLPVQKVDK